MEVFVSPHSVVRRIWGRSDTVMLIFAGAAAEFALNKAVDWLYFTGRLPADPIGRLFSTVSYAQRIIFSSKEDAWKAMDGINAIHANLEVSRQMKIPDWAYRDVLYMLIHYSQAAFEALERRPMTVDETIDLFDVFHRVGEHMHIPGLPDTYEEWVVSRQVHLLEDLAYGNFSADLFKQYRKHLGRFRYGLLLEAHKLVVPEHAKKLLGLGGFSWLSPWLVVYRAFRWTRVDGLLTMAALPPRFRQMAPELTPKAV
jgi:hypothetical protein